MDNLIHKNPPLILLLGIFAMVGVAILRNIVACDIYAGEANHSWLTGGCIVNGIQAHPLGVDPCPETAIGCK